MAWKVLLTAFAVAWLGALPAWGTWEEWDQEGPYNDIGVVASDELRVVVEDTGVVLIESGEVVDQLSLPGIWRKVDTDGSWIIWGGKADLETSKLAVTDMGGNLIAEKAWSGLAMDVDVLGVAVWGSYGVVAQQQSVNVYDLETLDLVAEIFQKPTGAWPPMIGEGNGRLIIGMIESVGPEDEFVYVTVYEIDRAFDVSNTIGPFIACCRLGVGGLSPAPDGGFYLGNKPTGESGVFPVPFRFDADGNLVESMDSLQDLPFSFKWDIDGCYNVIGVSTWPRDFNEVYKGFKWVPNSRDPGCFVDALGHLFEHDITWLGREAITRGCNPPLQDRFCSDDFVTRSQMAAFLHRAFDDVLTPTGQADFIDDDGNTFESDIEWLGRTGVTKGCNPPANDRYCPNDLVTRGQMAALLVRALGYSNDGGGDRFVDDGGSNFEADIDKLGTAGVTKGCNPPVNDRFCPDDFVTRGEMAAFLHRALDS